MLKIGFYSRTYPFERNIIDKCGGGVQYNYITLMDDDSGRQFAWFWFRVFNRLHITKGKESLQNRLTTFYESKKNYDCDLIHSFNAIMRCNKDYVMTFESSLPRCKELLNFAHEEWKGEYTKEVNGYIEELADSRLKKMIAMSHSAYRITTDIIEKSDVDESIKGIIKGKMVVIHPPQKLLCTKDDIYRRYSPDKMTKLKMIFVGRDFFRKGGAEVIEVLKKWSNQCELIIISSLAYDDYATRSTKTDRDAVKKYIERSDWVTYYDELENSEVLELCKSAHIGLLPTYADTYGYSVLEMQACGLPVVTTDIRALPEINDNECGWIAEIPHNEYGEALFSTENSRRVMRETLKRELENIFENIFSHREQIQNKALMAYSRIKRDHDPQTYGESLYSIYKESLEK